LAGLHVEIPHGNCDLCWSRLFRTVGPCARTKLLRACSVKTAPTVCQLPFRNGGLHIGGVLTSPASLVVPISTTVSTWDQEGIDQRTTYVYRDLSPVRVFDGGIIALNPLIVNKLGCVLVSVGPIQGLPRLRVARTRETAFPDTTLR